MKHVETRCPMDPEAKDALEPGDLDKLFERIVRDPYYKQYEPVVLSRPSYAQGDTADTANYKIGLWLIMLENIVSGAEADRMIELGGIRGYERSSDVGAEKEDGTYTKNVNSGRTSTNAWCTDECYADPVAVALMDRIANTTGIPEPNSENLQLLRYEKDQYYQVRDCALPIALMLVDFASITYLHQTLFSDFVFVQTHNDYIPYQLNRPCGVRILTFYIYLNNVEEGGGTNFPRVGATVAPKKGRAVLWPSVFNEDPHTKDIRSDHQAMPVIQGVKYGAVSQFVEKFLRYFGID
jgi:prolyl 4-hydroxylase